jgi:hypothetical protein
MDRLSEGVVLHSQNLLYTRVFFIASLDVKNKTFLYDFYSKHHRSWWVVVLHQNQNI